MNSERREELREIIRERKRKLWNDLREELFRKLGEDHSAQYEIPVDPGDESVLDLLEDAGLAVADIRRQELTLMDEAERRLESGAYGACDDCGRDIPVERLQVVPYTLYCVDCQDRHEGPVFPPKGATI